MRFTRSEFTREQHWNRIPRDADYVVLVWKFKTSEHTWEEIFMEGLYSHIETDLASFKNAMHPLCEFISQTRYCKGLAREE